MVEQVSMFFLNNMTKVTELKETICYEENDIKVFVRINYATNKISIVEPFGTDGEKFKKKEYTFVNRGVQYMNGWVNILQVMQNAIKLGKAMYEKELSIESAFKEKTELKNVERLNKITKKLERRIKKGGLKCQDA